MNDVLVPVLVRALQLLFELVVPGSLDLAFREILIAFLVMGAVWLYEALRNPLHRQTTPAPA